MAAPQTFKDVAKATMQPLTADEAAELEADPTAPAPSEPEEPIDVATSAEAMADLVGKEPASVEERPLPDWLVLPEGFKFPGRGRQVGFMRFRAAWTDTPDKGDRQCVLWGLTIGDEKLARIAMRGEEGRYLSEMAKRQIRALDGHAADWTGRNAAGAVDPWWNEIGYRCRQLIQSFFLKTHTLETKERIDFFANCIEVRTSR